MNTAIIYHWWNDNIVNVVEDKFNPIIFSISCIRNYNEYIPIYVISLSPKVNWGEYPKILNFKVFNHSSIFDYSNSYCCNLMSRIFQISECAKFIPEDNIIFCDSDVFWIKNPLPLMNDMDMFNCNSNNGVFYYNKKNEKSIKFISACCENINKTVCDNKFRNKILQSIGFDLNFKVHDELIFRYTQSMNFDLFNPVPLKENNIIFTPITEAKNIHIIRAFVGKQDRLSVAISICEIKNSIKNVLGDIQYNASSFFISELNTKSAIKQLCCNGDYKRAMLYSISKLC